MKRLFRTFVSGLALAVATLFAANAPTPAYAQAKEVLTFAAVTFSEAGRGDRLKAWVDKFNKSQNAIEVQPVALPFASFAKTIFTQMGGGAGPDLVRFDQIDFYAAVAANRVLQLDEIINDRDYKFTAPDRYMKVGAKRYGTPFEISNYVLLYNPTLAMEIDNGGVAGIFNQQAPDLPLAAAPSPFPTRAQGLVLAPFTVNANTKHKAAAFTFYKWVLQPENQKQLQDLLGASNVATVVQRSPEDLAKRPWLKVYDDQTPNSIPQLVQGQELKTPEILQIVLEHVLKVLQGGADPNKTMDDAQKQAQARVARK